MKHLLIFIFLIWLPCILNSTVVDKFRFSHLTNNDGLPGNTVYSILEDHKGYFWFGTKNGICKYDGRNFTVYEYNSSDSTSLPGNDVRYIFEDSTNRLWVATNNGLTYYNGEQNRFITVIERIVVRGMVEDEKGGFYLATPRGLRYLDKEYKQIKDYIGADNTPVNANANKLISDKNGDLWVGTRRGLYHVSLADSIVTTYTNEQGNKHSLPSDFITSLFLDSRNILWLGTSDKGLVRFDRNSGQFESIEGLSNSYIRQIAEDEEGRLWIGTEWGLNIYDPEKNTNIVCLNDLSNANSISDNAIYSIYRDRENNMVVGTYFGGLNLLLKSYQRFVLYVPELSNQSIGGRAVRQIIGADGNDLWIATENGGLNYYHSDKDNFTRYGKGRNGLGLTTNNIHALLKDKDGLIWIGTYLGGLNRYDPKTGKFSYYTKSNYPAFNNNNIFALLQDREGIIWVGTTAGVLTYNKEQNRFRRFEKETFGNEQVDILFEDSSGNIWLGTHLRGVFQYNKESGEFINYSRQTTPDLSDDYINYIYEDENKNIWISTQNGGLNLIRPTDNTITVYDKKNGMPSNTVYGLIQDNNNFLWIATNNGLVKFDKEKNAFTTFTTQDGLPNNQFNYNSVYKDKSGRIYFGTINGLTCVLPDMTDMPATNLKVDIVDMKIMGKSVIPNEEDSPLTKSISETSYIKLTGEQARSFSLEFSAPSLAHSRNVSYAIRLNNIDKDWVNIGNQYQVTYANLPAGNYEFMVRAALNDNWNESNIQTIQLTILPPFWKSWKAYLIYFLFFCGLAFAAFRIISIRQKERHIVITERLEKEKLKEVNRLKINFFTNISHELRTPLTLIVSPIFSILNQFKLPEEAKNKMLAIQKNVHRMQSLIDELILLSKIETEAERVCIREGFVLRFIIEIANGFRLLAESRDIRFSINITVSKFPVWFDPSKLEKIVFNLLSNAFKYTDPGGEIQISAELFLENEVQKLRIAVADSGCGIPENELPKIFDKYYQTINTAANNGFGIGLNMVRQLAQLHKGNVEVESREGEGSTFIIVLTVDRNSFDEEEVSKKKFDNQVIDNYSYLLPEEEDNEEVDKEIVTDQSGEKQHILIVDDNKELLNFMHDIFNREYHTTLCMNGKEGLITALEQSPDLIISDLLMPEMNGLEFCREIKTSIETCHIPFVILTAKVGDENKMEGYEYGAEAYVEKPFNPAILMQRVKNLLKMQMNLSQRMRDDSVLSFTEEPTICTQDKKLLEAIHTFIIAHIGDNLSMSDITRAIGISRTLLHTKLKKTGWPLSYGIYN